MPNADQSADAVPCGSWAPDFCVRCKLHFNHLGPHQWWDGAEPAVHPAEWENTGWEGARYRREVVR